MPKYIELKVAVTVTFNKMKMTSRIDVQHTSAKTNSLLSRKKRYVPPIKTIKIFHKL